MPETFHFHPSLKQRKGKQAVCERTQARFSDSIVTGSSHMTFARNSYVQGGTGGGRRRGVCIQAIFKVQLKIVAKILSLFKEIFANLINQIKIQVF
jgi:hypothetical protein